MIRKAFGQLLIFLGARLYFGKEYEVNLNRTALVSQGLSQQPSYVEADWDLPLDELSSIFAAKRWEYDTGIPSAAELLSLVEGMADDIEENDADYACNGRMMVVNDVDFPESLQVALLIGSVVRKQPLEIDIDEL